MLYELDGVRPEIHEEAWVAPSATVIGRVVLHRLASVWFGATLRGDNDRIEIGAETSIQDGSVLHTDPGLALIVGAGVTVGHLVMLHGCTIGDGSLVGIGSVVLNGARIGRNCLIGAKALVTEGLEVPDNSLVLGAPAKIVRTLSEAHVERLRASAQSYVDKCRRYRSGLVALD
ncbi:Carbonic anhydrase or acetyltransferase, isoleucine patch superfamily [Tistlia consotensis]|uniref:Carbonic anhydrase or acetyltransferase, isoleucine patch superfamily n=1 Tax=Tistlia consotensis USBA 355 TaxID=560819 RepID=A0A1Y6BZT7_9PROT|nr:gamma carbonic anhydrase family protein [Tistlia consotensis]SMF29169.1 Carbonic anhydrase or acetyltransferase, isoleucine patch superfamily [Tistlia consotensis USBA 355]SNR91554.1 Carbonic anhydrase or acetyltransferase, isoleucine patch superfamily [Tistlia consotensis]